MQRPPPLILTFPSVLDDDSRIKTSIEGAFALAITAEKYPAAPPPTTTRLGPLELVEAALVPDLVRAGRERGHQVGVFPEPVVVRGVVGGAAAQRHEVFEVLGREVMQAVQRDLFADERLLHRPPVGGARPVAPRIG